MSTLKSNFSTCLAWGRLLLRLSLALTLIGCGTTTQENKAIVSSRIENVLDANPDTIQRLKNYREKLRWKGPEDGDFLDVLGAMTLLPNLAIRAGRESAFKQVSMVDRIIHDLESPPPSPPAGQKHDVAQLAQEKTFGQSIAWLQSTLSSRVGASNVTLNGNTLSWQEPYGPTWQVPLASLDPQGIRILVTGTGTNISAYLYVETRNNAATIVATQRPRSDSPLIRFKLPYCFIHFGDLELTDTAARAFYDAIIASSGSLPSL